MVEANKVMGSYFKGISSGGGRERYYNVIDYKEELKSQIQEIYDVKILKCINVEFTDSE